ncbi:MAG: hypothetical protein WC516_09710 [Patescibacteria group bacterium]|jgi:hypothetical protein
MSISDRWYMSKDRNGHFLQHDPRGCSCRECRHINEGLEQRFTAIPQPFIVNTKRNIVIYHGKKHVFDGNWQYLGME